VSTIDSGGQIASARKNMVKQVARLLGDRTVEVIQEAVIGRPEEEILRFQHKNDVDLVVISSVGKIGVSRYLIGSVAQRVLCCSPNEIILPPRGGLASRAPINKVVGGYEEATLLRGQCTNGYPLFGIVVPTCSALSASAMRGKGHCTVFIF